MNIVALLGSPRRGGNSDTIAEIVLDQARSMGGKVKTFALNDLDFKGCQGCESCKNGREDCALKDDLTEVLADVAEADALVLASPVYYRDVTAQMKMFIDRTYSYLKPDFTLRPDPVRLRPGKKLVFIWAQGSSDEGQLDPVLPRYDYVFSVYGYNQRETIIGCELMGKKDALIREDILNRAREAGKKLCD